MNRKTYLSGGLLLLALLVLVGLQWMLIQKQYASEMRMFQSQINQAYSEAFDKTKTDHVQHVLQELKVYLKDSSKVKITGDWDAKKKSSVFTITDVDQTLKGQHRVQFSNPLFPNLENETVFNENAFIDAFLKSVGDDLKEGVVWYYTANIGQFLEEHYFQKGFAISKFEENFQLRLKEYQIDSPFQFQPILKTKNSFETQVLNLQVSKAAKPKLVKAYFSSPHRFLLHKMTATLALSFLLVAFTAFLFWYLFRRILTQERLNEEKDRLIANITHELKTPVAVIQVSAEALETFELTEKEQEKYLGTITHQTGLLNHLITQFLEETLLGERPLKKEKVDCVPMLQELVTTFQNDTTIITLNSLEKSVFFVDASLFMSSVRNLIDNAIKYQNQPIKQVEITIKSNKNFQEIHIVDLGIGISETQNLRIFERFYRVSDPNIHTTKGYGLGLSIVKKTMELHQGYVRVEANRPQGSIFILGFSKYE